MIHLKCPPCGAHLNLPAAMAVGDKLLVCPKCQYKGSLSSYITLAPTPIEEDHHTVIASGLTLQSATAIGQLKDSSGKLYPLTPGTNRFGRAVEGSNCEHPIANTDNFLSRSHFSVEVTFNKQRLCYDHCLCDLGSKNGTSVNGVKLGREDLILLQPTDCVKAGETEFLFEIPSPDDTQII